jgi:hypothetical protein
VNLLILGCDATGEGGQLRFRLRLFGCRQGFVSCTISTTDGHRGSWEGWVKKRETERGVLVMMGFCGSGVSPPRAAKGWASGCLFLVDGRGQAPSA